jgi:hypothetical protein
MSEPNYASISIYLHAYLASHAKWPSDKDGQERSRIIVIGLAVSHANIRSIRALINRKSILAKGPKDVIKKSLVGDLVFRFLVGCNQHREWLTSGAIIQPEAFLQENQDPSDDPVLRQIGDVGFPEIQRRCVALLESWGQAKDPTAANQAPKKPDASQGEAMDVEEPRVIEESLATQEPRIVVEGPTGMPESVARQEGGMVMEEPNGDPENRKRKRYKIKPLGKGEPRSFQRVQQLKS